MAKEPKKTEVTPSGKTKAREEFDELKEKVARLEAEAEERRKQLEEAKTAEAEAKEAAEAEEDDFFKDLLP
jgi:hypothetical protein